MLKEICPENITVGMYVADTNISWWQHHFANPSFFVDGPEVLKKILECGSKSMTIDLEKKLKVKKSSNTLLSNAKNTVKNLMMEAKSGNISSIEDIYELSESMVDSIVQQDKTLLSLTQLKSKDDYTFTHCVTVGFYMIALGKKLGFSRDELQSAGIAGLLHDIGKAFSPLDILNKPGRLSTEEMDIIRTHPIQGFEALKNAGYDNAMCLDVVRHHHEKMDGNGYPDKLASHQISTLVRMSAIADVYDAITSKRCYHQAIAPTAALKTMMSEHHHFDKDLMKNFVSILGLYPTASLVRLSNQHLAIVIGQNSNIVTPRVLVVFSVKHNFFINPYELDLSKSTEHIINYEEPTKWNIAIEKYQSFY